MSRRILLIDADTEFRETLNGHLGPYRVNIMTETDADRALAMAASEGPDLVVIAVEEPDKGGFKTFQRARKTLPAKLPIVLVTKSMSPDSFAKHRSLKVHADEYIDKRGVTRDELIGKLGNLIGLGDLEDDGLAVDDIPMEIGEGDVVLDEQMEDPAGEFDDVHQMATVGGNNTVLVDQMVSQELDGAFDALLGDDGGVPQPVKSTKSRPLPGVAPIEEPVPEPVPEAVDAAEDDSGIPEPVPHVIPDDEPEEEPPTKSQWDVDSIPATIMDGGRSTGSFEAQSEDDELNPAEPVRDEQEEPQTAVEAASDEAPASDVDEEAGHEASLSSIPIVDDDLVSLDDDEGLEEIEEPKAEEPEPVKEPSGATPMAARDTPAAEETVAR